MIDDYYDFLLKKCVPVISNNSNIKERVTAATVRDIHKVLRTAFNQAKRWKLIRQNPFLDADVPEHKSKDRPAFAPSEYEKILEYTDDPNDYERYTIHVALCIQYYCTTRGGEVGGLQWPDYNPNKKTLHIYKALDRVDKASLDLPKVKICYMFPILNPFNKSVVVLKSPKTEETKRHSKLNDLMMEKLNCLKVMQQDMMDNIFGDSYQDHQLIICQPSGRPIMVEQLNRKFKAIILEMRGKGYEFSSVPENLLDDVVFHSIRASSCTIKMQLSNGNVKAVMAAGGWAEPDMVIRCSRTYEQDQEEIAKKMEEGFLKADNTPKETEEEKLRRLMQDNPELVRTLFPSLPEESLNLILAMLK